MALAATTLQINVRSSSSRDTAHNVAVFLRSLSIRELPSVTHTWTADLLPRLQFHARLPPMLKQRPRLDITPKIRDLGYSRVLQATVGTKAWETSTTIMVPITACLTLSLVI